MDRNLYAELSNLYYGNEENYKHGAFQGAKKFYQSAKRIIPTLTYDSVLQFLLSQTVYNRSLTFRKTPKAHLPKSYIYASHPHYGYSLDSFYLPAQIRTKIFKMCLVICDQFTRKLTIGLVRGDMNSKKATEILMEIIKNTGRSPQIVVHDAGPEFSGDFVAFVSANNIINVVTSSQSMVKAAHAERAISSIRTLLRRILLRYPKVTAKKAVKMVADIFNSSPHSALPPPLTPLDAEKPENWADVLNYAQQQRYKKMTKDFASSATKYAHPKAKFHIGSCVRVLISPIARSKFFKGHHPTTPDVSYYVREVIFKDPGFVYRLKSRNNINVKGQFLEQQLLHSEQI